MVSSVTGSALVLLACTSFITANADPKVLKMNLNRRPRNTIIRKRDPQSVAIGNAEEIGLYNVNASVGSPPQVVQLQIDTGSSDVWMFGPSAYQACDQQCEGGYYDPHNSSTYNLVSQGSFSIQYETPGSGVVGDYFTDTFSIGSLKLSNLTMAVASQANSTTTGIMGIAFDNGESIVSNSNFTVKPYNSIIDTMVQQGVINSRAYSLYLDDLETGAGTVLFGGYDTAKFTGDLTVLDIQVDAQTGQVDDFAVVWSLLAVTDSTGTTALQLEDFPAPAILDSGTTLTIVPQDIFDVLAEYFGAQSTNDYGYVVSCADAQVEGSVDYGFGGDGGPIISVPFSELALPLYDNNGNPVTFDDGSAACSFGFDVAQQGTPILLGDTFLRSAYVVYDLDNKQIAIANSFWNATESNIVAIGNSSTGGAIASASSAVGVSVTQTATGNVAAPGVETGNPTATNLQATPTYSAGVSQISGAKTSLLGLGVHGVTSTAAAASSTSSKGAAQALAAPIRGLPSLGAVVGTFAAVFGGCLLVIAVM